MWTYMFVVCVAVVFGVDGDEVTSVSVMEGDSVTLHTDITQIQRDLHIIWSFDRTNLIAEIITRDQMNSVIVSEDGLFRDHLQMNSQTGSLTITNITTEHNGVYKLTIIRDKISYTSFTVIVYAPLPLPVITHNSSSSSSSSSSNCSLLCSVLNMRDVSLSWYNGNSLLSSISVSDLNIRLSLPLEVKYQNTNTYSCVVNNTITNQTQHLNITELCQPCSSVFGVARDEVKSVSVMEGESVTLYTNFTEIQQRDHILWMFGPQETRIAELYKQSIDMFDSNKTFGHKKLLLDSQSGSLTIKNIRTEHTGLYRLQIKSDRGNSDKIFNVTIYAPLPIPVIIRDSSQCPSSSSSSSLNCSLLCSVMNVRDVSLSWYKGNSLLSNISVSDLYIRLFLPLEVDFQDNNTYSCVVNNTITNQTQHLNITHLCQPCSECLCSCGFTETVIRLVLSALVGVAVVAIVIYDIRSRRVEQKPRSDITLRP
ncbi:uncharacterized protein [Misgurnus anguillicaudatus]|uniref:uncharacterized protein n=1 Tax=Misgurnus anguillicaudatus TaxID=75329 RepID=UPI003CCFDB11